MINNHALAARLRRIATRIEHVLSIIEKFHKSPYFYNIRREIKELRTLADKIAPPKKVN